jgi:hypothetical protein
MKNIKQKILNIVLGVALGAGAYFTGAYIQIEHYENKLLVIQSGHMSYLDDLTNQIRTHQDEIQRWKTLYEKLYKQSVESLTKAKTIVEKVVAEKSKQNRVIKNISLMESGEALGHGSFADKTTIAMMYDLCVKRGKVKSYINHGSFARAMESVGYFENFRVVVAKDGKTMNIVGDLVLYDTFQDPRVARFVEMVQESPEAIAISVTITAHHVYRDKKRYIRPVQIFSGDIVTFPALNKNGIHPRK